MPKKLLKGLMVVIGAIAVSSLGLLASDTMRGIDRDLVGLVGVGTGICPNGMLIVRNGEYSFCADQFEASAADSCAYTNPSGVLESAANIKSTACFPESNKGKTPWRFVSLTQAQTLCAAVGKRLPTSDEWYVLALGTRSDTCVLESNAGQPDLTGTAECQSSSGISDAVGNVWEWVNETVISGQFDNRTLPTTGYVTSVDTSGIAITTEDKEQTLFNEDYFWSKTEGTFGMLRGGFYGSGSDGGLYAVNASVETTFSASGVGFRCVKDL